MKLKLITLIFVALLTTGCETGGDTPDNPTGDNPVSTNPGGTNPGETDPGTNPGENPEENPSGSNPGESTPPVTAKNAGWYLRTVATATAQDGKVYVHKTAGVFGLLAESSNEKDRHDIAAYGEGAAILQVLFTPTEWGEDNGNYFSNYKHYDESHPNERNVWKFQVRNPKSVNLADADLKLDLVGPYAITSTKQNGSVQYKETLSRDMTALLNNLTLVDVDNQREYGYDELKNANLGMDGVHTRSFRWVVGPVTQEDFKPW
jgi:hypothetical protein